MQKERNWVHEGNGHRLRALGFVYRVVSRKIGHEVTLYGREGSRHIEQFCRTRTNGLVTLEDDVRITTNLREALESELICISIRSQNLPDLMAQIARPKRERKNVCAVHEGHRGNDVAPPF